MDGYHLPRTALSAMPDPATAHFRRGAHWTFSPAKLAALIASCRAPINPSPSSVAPTIYAASFDHAVKDPVEDDIPITPEQRILIFEGNYLSLSAPPEWLAVSSQFDERWFVEVDEEVAKQRLARRHLKAGIVGSLEEGVRRAEGNDIPNGRFLIANRVPVDQVLTSVEDVNFVEA
jgi:pantothenate kinase